MVDDFIEDSVCKTCIHYNLKTQSCLVKDERIWGKEESHPSLDSTCSFWTGNTEESLNKLAYEIYMELIDILKYYIEMNEDNYKLIALWIMGTYVHKEFPTFPYLYFNAMKGSAKTRTEKLIKWLAWGGDMLTSLSEAVIFRTTGTLIIDEFEGIRGKDKNNLRELLNTAYKRGGKVKRMKRKRMRDEKGDLCDNQVVEEFDTYRPIVMANISGMEEVLGDRCINLILEKSNNPSVTMLIENFENNKEIDKIVRTIQNWCSLVQCSYAKNIYDNWNKYVKETTVTTHNNIYTYNNNKYTKLHLFNKLYNSKIEGRNLELFFPLLVIAEEVGKFESILEIIKRIISEKKEESIYESKDVMLYSFVADKCDNEMVKIKELTNLFRHYVGDEQNEEVWLNPKWMGRALKRLNLIIEKKRIGEGIQVLLNVPKAKEKMSIFRE